MDLLEHGSVHGWWEKRSKGSTYKESTRHLREQRQNPRESRGVEVDEREVMLTRVVSHHKEDGLFCRPNLKNTLPSLEKLLIVGRIQKNKVKLLWWKGT
mmetsp:Transcript_4170/g.26426  ORF Transcript_4170/g.26426 Transcript_4170/m.26426 type:complete len:99 (+) Transcript_4170:369-665(+)